MLSDVSSKNCILMGDFNYGHTDWSIGACKSGATEECKLFLRCLLEGLITEHVTSRTTERSLLDVVLTNEPELVDEVKNFGNFLTSDHGLLFLENKCGQGAYQYRSN